jgi:hypothetical protein
MHVNKLICKNPNYLLLSEIDVIQPQFKLNFDQTSKPKFFLSLRLSLRAVFFFFLVKKKKKKKRREKWGSSLCLYNIAYQKINAC